MHQTHFLLTVIKDRPTDVISVKPIILLRSRGILYEEKKETYTCFSDTWIANLSILKSFILFYLFIY